MHREDFDAMLEMSIRIINGIACAKGDDPIKLERWERQTDIEGHDQITIVISGLTDELD